MTDDVMNTRQAAHSYHLSPSWLNKLRVTGDGPEYIKLGNKVLYRRSDIERWLDENRRRSTSDAARKSEREGCTT